jgi:hypothetical protein
MSSKISSIMNTEVFNIFFSFVLGAGLVAIARAPCKGDNCTINKAPPIADWKDQVYRIGADCYEYKTTTVQCPPPGKQELYEAFGLQKQRASELSKAI